MNEDKHKTTKQEADRMFIRYHAALTAKGLRCSCCPDNIDAAEAEAGYRAAKQEAEAAEDRYRKVKGATAI